MPRRRRPGSGRGRDASRPTSGPSSVEVGGEVFLVRSVSGAASTKRYRCPGCDYEISSATPHMVCWPAQPRVLGSSGLAERRHWHNGCWRSFVRTVGA